MRNAKKTLLAAAAAAALALVALAAPAPALAATEAKDAGLITGSFTYTGHDATTDSGEMTDSYVYSDAYFATSSATVNDHLATMSLALSASSITSRSAATSGDWTKASQNLKALLGDLGFSGFATNDDYQRQPGTSADGSSDYDSMGAACAYKKITVGGQEYTLLALVPRTSGYKEEWAGDFHVANETGDGKAEGYHYGFWLAKNKVIEFAQSYVKAQGITGKVKVWTVGYSRGAGTANLVGAALVDDASLLGNSTTVSPSDVYAYCYGTPATVLESHIDTARDYSGIHSFFCDYDVVTMVPFSGWGYVRYGTSDTLNSVEKKAEFLGFLKGVNSAIYSSYTKDSLFTGSVDPDDFTVCSFDKDFNMVVAPSSEQVGQKAFFEARFAQLTKHVSESDYLSGDYQNAIMALSGLYLGYEDEIAAVGGATTSTASTYTAAIPVLAWYLTDYYASNPQLAQARITNLYELIEQYVNAQAAGTDVESLAWAQMRDSNASYKAFMQALSDFGTCDADDAEAELVKLNATMWEYAKLGVWSYFNEAVGSLVTKSGSASWATQYYAKIVGSSEYDSAASKTAQEEVIGPVVKLVAYLIFSTEGNDEPISYDCEQLQNLATFMANGGNLMRAHNNELMISWLRTSDSYYKGSGIDPELYSSFKDVKAVSWYFNSVEWAAKKGLVTGYGDSGLFGPNDAMTREQFVCVLYRAAKAEGLDVGLDTETNILSFDDAASVSSWAVEAMQWAVGAGVMQGEGGVRLNPQGKVSREQVATFLYRYAKKYGSVDAGSIETNILSFGDAEAVSSWAMEAMQWAVGEGVVKGVHAGTTAARLEPARNATRAEVVTMLQRYCTE